MKNKGIFQIFEKRPAKIHAKTIHEIQVTIDEKTKKKKSKNKTKSAFAAFAAFGNSIFQIFKKRPAKIHAKNISEK